MCFAPYLCVVKAPQWVVLLGNGHVIVISHFTLRILMFWVYFITITHRKRQFLNVFSQNVIMLTFIFLTLCLKARPEYNLWLLYLFPSYSIPRRLQNASTFEHWSLRDRTRMLRSNCNNCITRRAYFKHFKTRSVVSKFWTAVITSGVRRFHVNNKLCLVVDGK